MYTTPTTCNYFPRNKQTKVNRIPARKRVGNRVSVPPQRTDTVYTVSHGSTGKYKTIKHQRNRRRGTNKQQIHKNKYKIKNRMQQNENQFQVQTNPVNSKINQFKVKNFRNKSQNLKFDLSVSPKIDKSRVSTISKSSDVTLERTSVHSRVISLAFIISTIFKNLVTFINNKLKSSIYFLCSVSLSVCFVIITISNIVNYNPYNTEVSQQP